MPKPKLTDADYCRAAKTLRCDVSTIKAVAEVESRGEGFYEDGFPVILFERHKFHKFTNGRFDSDYPEISNPVAGGYGAGGANQRRKFSLAFGLDPIAAMKSCSWGKFQIMGFNYDKCGFPSVGKFVDAMKESEGRQLDAFVQFLIHAGLAERFRAKDFEGIAAGYNGAGYKKNHYDTKMAAADKKYAAEHIDCSDALAADPVESPVVDLSATNSPDPAVSSQPSSSDPPPTKQVTEQTQTEIVQQGTTTSATETKTTSDLNAAIEREEHPTFIGYMWKKVTAAITAIGGTTAVTNLAQQGQTFGLTPNFWASVIVIVAAVLTLWIITEAIKWFFGVYLQRQRTNKLAELNSTATNMVVIVPKDQLQKYEDDPNWVVIRRSNAK